MMMVMLMLVLMVMLTTSRFMGVCNGQYVSVHVLSAERDGFLRFRFENCLLEYFDCNRDYYDLNDDIIIIVWSSSYKAPSVM